MDIYNIKHELQEAFPELTDLKLDTLFGYFELWNKYREWSFKANIDYSFNALFKNLLLDYPNTNLHELLAGFKPPFIYMLSCYTQRGTGWWTPENWRYRSGFCDYITELLPEQNEKGVVEMGIQDERVALLADYLELRYGETYWASTEEDNTRFCELCGQVVQGLNHAVFD